MPVDQISRLLLRWYDANARQLPWRQPPASPRRPDPYAVWLSEIMLQQTGVVAAAPYWQRFLTLWPDVAALAAADEAQVMQEWAGLGYYARARNLLATAQIVARSGGFPESAQALRALPGIGPYTAAAIAAIAFGEQVLMVDTNVVRVGARLFAIDAPPPRMRALIDAALSPHVPPDRPGDFGQALMDLGATICTPRAPACPQCPLASQCLAHQQGNPERLPQRAARTPRPLRHGTAWWIEHDKHVALVRRPPTGLLGGMLALPGTPWGSAADTRPPFPARWRTGPAITHIFTHFELRLALLSARVGERPHFGPPLIWTPVDALAGLPTLYARAASALSEPA